MTSSQVFGPVGYLQSNFSPVKDSRGIPLVLHPHPLYGGNMHNKVVYTIYKALADLNFSVLRINFRGVGLSEGSYDNGHGELEDALRALEWLKEQVPHYKTVWVCGFSFGSWVATRLLEREPEIDRFIAVSPPVVRFGFDHVLRQCSKGLVVQGDSDDIVPFDKVEFFIKSLDTQCPSSVTYHLVSGADHFYKGHLDVLTSHIKAYGEQIEQTSST